MELTGKQKRYLRSKAHHLDPIFQIGKNGLNKEVIVQIGEALEKRELIKINLLQNTDESVDEVAAEIERALGCDAVQVIGRVIVLFSPSSQEKYQRISTELPAKKKK
ncbi:MAG: ribosome assembly RNA-binding protein YhbY [Carnobacterium sp.]|uniref:Ribosome assembly RNA-binding protein YhbY n=1 Tax=Carnobacterium antarcticum TaxID=2126436 RepID=A0ABW4NS32_9LACT|nr:MULTISPECIES: ribosome assembly RNA-binding protein YhbY [unclassified Carnobacterium]ALV20705.1 RNA binding protein [Carnobacterium sp. CP1]QQP70937.1 ribosome assembly RNA-binding protein YhbY [Carnobacterium sp. CS13]